MPASPAEGPPLRVPMLFFATAIGMMIAAGALLVVVGGAALASGWARETLALTHLGTLGVITTTMCGATYQLVPVLAGRAVRWPVLAYGTYGLLTLGVLALVMGVLTSRRGLVVVAMSLLGPFVLAFVAPAGLGLGRALDASVRAMRLGHLSLGLLALLGLWIAHGHSGGRFPGDRVAWIQVHAGTAFLGWVGATILGVSWRVLPMFFLTEPPSPRVRSASVAAIGLGVLGPIGVLATQHDGTPSRAALALASAPALLAVWCVHPVLTLRSLRARRRARVDPALVGWGLAMIAGACSTPLAAAAVTGDDGRAPLALGWLAITGWAGMAIHAMLLRVVPFLVWLHRHAPNVGMRETPSVRQLLPDARAWPGLAAHLVALLAGLASIATRGDTLARVAGLALVAASVLLGRAMLGALAARGPAFTTLGT